VLLRHVVASGACPVGVRGFESHPPHYGFGPILGLFWAKKA